MKMNKSILILAVLTACASPTVNRQKESLPQETPPLPSTSKPSEESPEVSGFSVPRLILPENATSEMIKAKSLFEKYMAQVEVYEFARKKIPSTLQGGNETSRDEALIRTLECFKTLGDIPVRFKNYGVWPLYKSNAIGGWDGVQINQNPRYSMSPEETVGHWAHELTHACKFTHISNNISSHPIIRQSWPYQFGYAVEDYVTEKESRKVAGE